MVNIKELSISYEGKKVISDLDLKINRNKITAVVGESGTGKTSLALALMGLNNNVTKGEIIVENENVLMYSEQKMREYRGKKIGIVFQNSGDILNPTVKIFKQVAESMIEHGFCLKLEAYERAKKLLSDVGIEKKDQEAYSKELSGGQIQRVLIAMALANDPEILIFDEFTSALDSLTKMEIIKLIRRIAENKTILLITHDFSVAEKLADEIVVLYGGMVAESGEVNKILKDPIHPYTRGLLRSYPNMSTTKDLQGIKGKAEICIKGCPFANRCTQSIGKCYDTKPDARFVKGRMVACHRNGTICLLKASKVTKKYRKRLALKNIDFSIYEGETLAVVGESGSGKTTLAKCIMGLENMDSGKLFLNEEKIITRTKKFYKEAQIIYQNPKSSINRDFNVIDAVKEPLDIHNIGSEEYRIEKAKSVLEEVHLPNDDEFMRTLTHKLSGGESQRLAIARSLILNPKFLIADEATSALDVSVQAKIMKLFMELQEKRGLTLLFITHDIALARKVSDKIIVLKDGEIVEEGSSADLINNPKNEYTKRLLEASAKIF
ncbi:MAG: ABC transporter ATP-binding protein [Tissierellales bacterium]|nr:ABC transporter ATP-binding protein [Tissierellales bacterium]